MLNDFLLMEQCGWCCEPALGERSVVVDLMTSSQCDLPSLLMKCTERANSAAVTQAVLLSVEGYGLIVTHTHSYTL